MALFLQACLTEVNNLEHAFILEAENVLYRNECCMTKLKIQLNEIA